MRHASQLCRGLAEASRSLERPYIPRHVPLPSSSYSAAAQNSATPTAPKPNVPRRSSKEAGKISEAARGSFQQGAPPTQPPSQRRAIFRHRSSHRGELDHSSIKDGQNVKQEKPLSSTFQKTGLSPLQYRNNASLFNHPQPMETVPTADEQPIQASSTNTWTSKTLSVASGRTSSTSNRSRLAQAPPSQEAQRLMAAYPGLSKDQITLLLQTFRQIHSLRSHPPGALVAWYEELIWTTERQAQGWVRMESPQSLSMLLRFAYQRNDLRSLLRIESRAARLSSTFSCSRNDASASNVSPKELGSTEVDGVGVWPEANEDPRRLAYNLKVAFAAREGNWVKVDELLTQPSPSIAKASKGQAIGRGPAPTDRSEYALDATGWGGLLRFGLGSVPRLDVESRYPVTSVVLSGNGKQVTSTAPTSASETVSALDPVSIEIEAQKLRKAKEGELQAQAKLSVTKRLLPHLLRFTSTPKNSDKATNSAQDPTSRSAEPTTPVWLLHAVLKQLAERGDAASTVRIARLALSEKSALEQLALVRGGSNRILNFALMACSQNHFVNLTETLRIFNSLTGSQLGLTISGSTVLAQPKLLDEGKGQSQSRMHLKQASDRPQQKIKQGSAASAGQARFIPNEESLILVLKKVQHPLFRAAWTRKLVDEFQQLFPTVKLSGRTFRMIIDKCVAPAPGTSPEKAALSSPAPSPAAQQHSKIASGRRGRRLRQQAAEQMLPDPEPSPVQSSKIRGPIVKRSILIQTLTEILTRFDPTTTTTTTPLLLHLSTTNRRRFELTLLKAKRCLLVKKQHHMDQIDRAPSEAAAREGYLRHEKAALSEIEKLLTLIAQVQRLGRSDETRKWLDLCN
ncbi:uncharacterized protein UTRI_01852 [Ustilago trichophora]|uniref:Uncharacterized protein n=1 Tax=Ustilago trichophora TaxID=86804 RepID=A0A5C3DXI6_9BASI|nr:uncharacterized protein UTRI_01852 [Ustilago trichophora]